MTKKSTQIKALFEQVKINAELRASKLKLEVLNEGNKLGANIITNTLAILCGLLAFIFATLTLGFLLSEFTNSYIIGFSGLTVLYVLIALLAGLFKEGFIERKIMNFTIRKYFSKYYGKKGVRS